MANKELKVGDIVKYINGQRHYTITGELNSQNGGTSFVLDGEYQALPRQLERLNLYRVGDSVKARWDNGSIIPWRISNVKLTNGTCITYGLESTNEYGKKLYYSMRQNVLKTYNENENRLQEQEVPERRRSNSGTGRELCIRDRICFEIGYRGNEHSVDQSTECAQRRYDDLSLGQQEVPGCEGSCERLQESSGVPERGTGGVPDEEVNDNFWTLDKILEDL